ncbi:MAG TPA: hypothetical protein VJ838_07720 [Gaiellaceae bacterium]|nr:hypothetical protein [Gaiellaceae bacterium]
MRGLVATLAVALAMLVPAATATGSAGTQHLRPAGIVPHLSAAQSAGRGLPKPLGFAAPSSLTFDANYVSLINRYFADVAHDSGLGTNVYSTDPQYTDGGGPAQYASTFGGSVIARDPLPPNGCDDTDNGLSDPVCLDDAQLEAEIQTVMTAEGWHGSPSTMFFLMTPTGVGSCFLPGNATVSSDQACSTDTYCAYHSAFTNSQGEPVIYANEPYDATTSVPFCLPRVGGTNQSPNADDADATINTISHEHNEAITDPFLDAWYTDAGGAENGDLCAWTWGALSGTAGAEYNQTINGNNYLLQQEWSNVDAGATKFGCVQHLGGTTEAPPSVNGTPPLVYHPPGLVMHTNTTYAIYWLPTAGNTGAPALTGSAAVNQVLTSSVGSWTGSATSYSYQWQRCLPSGAGCVNIPGATASTYTLASSDAGNVVRSTVTATNVNGVSPYAASGISSVVIPVPEATAPPVISGVPAAGKAISVSSGTWNTPASFSYQWLRCAANGTACAAVGGATGKDFFLLGGDAGHTFQVVVTATNAAGTGQTVSKRSALVVGVPHLKKAPRISGRARVGGRLTVTKGTWLGPPRSYRYQWLRCNARGGGCRSIRRATHPTYRATSQDAGHRFRVRVTASNAAGKKTATSGASARIAS